MSAPDRLTRAPERSDRRRVQVALGRLLGPALVRSQRRRAKGAVLLYHRVGPEVDPAFPPLPVPEFERHLDVITSSYEVVSLDALVRRARRGLPMTGLCALTFDDGYRDFLDHAYPVLARRQLPATHFLVTDCLESGRPTWNYRLNRVVARLGPAPARGWKNWLGTLSAERRHDWLLEQESGLGGTEPAVIRGTDLDAVDDRLVRWGSHSLSHPMLGGASAAVATAELGVSRVRLRDLGAGSVDHFAYPNGSFGIAARRAAAEAGYAAAFAVGQSAVRASSDPFALPRFDVGGRASDELLLEVSGALEGARTVRRAVRR